MKTEKSEVKNTGKTGRDVRREGFALISDLIAGFTRLNWNQRVPF